MNDISARVAADGAALIGREARPSRDRRGVPTTWQPVAAAVAFRFFGCAAIPRGPILPADETGVAGRLGDGAMATAAVDYGPEEKAMQAYFREGEARAMALGNRGPIRLTDEGKLHPDIVAAYKRVGFYVFEGVLDAGELSELEEDF